MSISKRTPGLVCRSLLPVVLASLSGFPYSATAQTAPQLLPYTAKLIAGSGTVAIAKGATCPVSGFTSLDAYGDGCLATEILIAPTSTAGSGPRYAVADKTGAVFFTDGTNGLVRRVDPITGIVTVVAGGAASNPASGTACGALTSTDSDGDGCLGTAVKLSHPTGLAFSPSGDLYFADYGFDDVRKIAATGGVITTTGVITNIAGGTTFGYNVNNTAVGGSVIAATQSYLNFPYGIAFDAAGNLYIADEGNNAIEVVNLTSASETLQGLVVPAGTIAKFAGYGSLSAKTATSGDCPDFVSTSSRGGCYFGLFTNGALANKSNVDSAYGVAVDPSGNVYFANEFPNNVGIISTTNVINNYAGIQNTAAKKANRGPAGSFGIGSDFGVAADGNSNVYITDASSGFIWRVDGAGQSMYVVGGGATTVCSMVIDAYGDGCPATQAKFGSSGTGNFASTTLPGPGIFGISVDSNSNLFFGDTETGLIREVASGTQFGKVGVTPVTQKVDIHFAAGDTPSAAAYTMTSGAASFTLGTATCTVNSDTTDDCVLPITAAPVGVSTGSIFTGTLQVTSKLGATGSFVLSGTYFGTPVTTTAVLVATSCAGNTVYLPTTPVALTANIGSSGSPTGTVTFFANGTSIGTAAVSNGAATLNYAFATPGTYTITATYSGDSYFVGSSGTSSTPVNSENPNFSLATLSYPSTSIYAGGTAVFSFNLAQFVYAGTISFAVSGLPANTTYSISPTSISSTVCSAASTVALSILTQQGSAVLPASLGGGGHGIWPALSALAGLGLALLIGLRRRRAPLHFGTIWMALCLLLAASGTVACGNGVTTLPRTPAGNYTITVTATGSAGGTNSLTLPTFTVN